MKLLQSPLSPYARKARILVLEHGMQDRVEMVDVTPYDDPAQLHAANPIGKIPTLILDDGSALYDSPVVCEYLDAVSGAPSLYATSGDARWVQQRRLALADGVMDLTFNISSERRRPEGERSASWIDRWAQGIARSLDVLEAEIADYPADYDIVHLATGVAADYAAFRAGDLVDIPAGRPRLAAWRQVFSARPSSASTAPG